MDIHAEPIARASWDFFFAFFREIERMGKHVIVEGGWAVAACGSPVASVDLDVIIREEEYDGDRDYYDLLHAEGRFRQDALSAVDWTFADFNACWVPSAAMTARSFSKGGRGRRLQSPDGRQQAITTPTLPALLVMKLKAFRDRELQFRVMQDPAEIASFDPHDIAQVHPNEGYRLRKAAKDLVDIGFLWKLASEDDRKELTNLLGEYNLRELIVTALHDCDAVVMSAADYLIERHAMQGSAAAIRTFLLEAL